MLEVEKEDEEEEDLKDLIGEMELDAESEAAFRAAVESIGKQTSDEPEDDEAAMRSWLGSLDLGDRFDDLHGYVTSALGWKRSFAEMTEDDLVDLVDDEFGEEGEAEAKRTAGQS